MRTATLVGNVRPQTTLDGGGIREPRAASKNTSEDSFNVHVQIPEPIAATRLSTPNDVENQAGDLTDGVNGAHRSQVRKIIDKIKWRLKRSGSKG